MVENQSAQEFKEMVAANKYTLIYYWATWCGPCIAQFLKLSQFYDKHKVAGFWEQKNVKWHNYSDYDLSIGSRIGVTALPTNFLLDSSGKILFNNISLKGLEQLLISEL